MNHSFKALFGVLFSTAALTLFPGQASAHCDALDGPIVLEAREALRDGDVTPLLKWVPAKDETEINQAFQRASAVAQSGDTDARELAETWFLETFVRIHREGEGASYSGLKAAGHIDPAIRLADEALKEGSAEELADRLSTAVRRVVLERFEEAAKRQKHAEHNAEAGREYVAAYVDYVHLVEAIHDRVTAGPGHAH